MHRGMPARRRSRIVGKRKRGGGWLTWERKGWWWQKGTAAEQPKLNDPLLAIALAELAGSCSGHRTVHKV